MGSTTMTLHYERGGRCTATETSPRGRDPVGAPCSTGETAGDAASEIGVEVALGTATGTATPGQALFASFVEKRCEGGTGGSTALAVAELRWPGEDSLVQVGSGDSWEVGCTSGRGRRTR